MPRDMTSCESCGTSSAVVVRNVNVGVLAKLLNQQRTEGQAANDLIASAANVAARASVRGAAEPGKGAQVDVVG